MFQRKQRALVVEHADVVGRAHLVDFGNQGLRAHQVAQAHAGQAELAQGAHQQHMAVLANAVDIALAGKRLIGLVHHHQPALLADGFDDFLDDRVVPQIGRGVVRVSQINDGRLVLRNGGQHGGFVKLKVGRQIDADELQALQLRAHCVHHKTRHGRQDAGTRHVAGHRQQRDQLVRAIAQHQAKALGQLRVIGQRGAQIVDAAIRVAVQRQRAQALAQLGLQRGRQPVRVFHGV